MIKNDYLKNHYEKRDYLNALPDYLEGASITKMPFYHTNINNTLEAISINDQPEKRQGLLEQLVTNKGKSQKATVKALLDEVELRQNLNLHLIQSIDDSLCRQKTELNHLKEIKTQYSFELAKNVYDSKLHLENNLIELEKEKRKEYLECWKDLMFLKKYLMSALREYWDFVKRKDLLSGNLK